MSQEAVSRDWEGDEERVSVGVDLPAAGLIEGVPQDSLMVGRAFAVAIPQLLEGLTPWGGSSVLNACYAVQAPASVPFLAWIETAAAVVAALGTVGAVVIALWLQVYRERHQRPSLQMTFKDDPESNEWAPVYRAGHRSLWLRFVVNNATGKNTAREVQVLVTRVLTPPERRELVPGGPLFWTDLRSPTIDLPSGISRMIDIAEVELPADTHSRTALWLKVSPVPGDTRHRLEPGTYDVELAVAAQGVDAVFYHTTLKFQDEWEDDPKDLVKHFKVLRFQRGRLADREAPTRR